MKIRRAGPADWPYVRELCCRTGNAGAPIDRARWPFFGQQWVGPYEQLEPHWTYLAENEKGERLGYLTGCADTSRFERRKKFLHDLPLLIRTKLLRTYLRNGDVERFEKRYLGLDQGPEQKFGASFLDGMKREYPAHLHTNVEDFARGTGAGRALVERFKADLLEHGIHGIHLFCGDKPLPFYAKVGFRELNKIEFRPGVFVYALGARF